EEAQRAERERVGRGERRRRRGQPSPLEVHVGVLLPSGSVPVPELLEHPAAVPAEELVRVVRRGEGREPGYVWIDIGPQCIISKHWDAVMLQQQTETAKLVERLAFRRRERLAIVHHPRRLEPEEVVRFLAVAVER